MQTKRVTLNQPHKSNGKTYVAGESLDMPIRLADWLIGQGVARTADAGAQVVTAGQIKARARPRPCCGRRSA